MKFGCRGYQDKVGVLIAQLGTPDAPTRGALRPYLKQFLSDPRVIEGNRLVWWAVLNGIILRSRPARSARLYSRIWTEKGSPLLLLTEQQRDGLQEALSGTEVEVEFGMRYGRPSLESAIDSLIAKGCARILLFPMYPQYAAATTASTYDIVFTHLLKRRWVPTLRVAAPYFDNEYYLHAQAKVINKALAAMTNPPERLVLSYHGIPYKYVAKGDPYCCMCTETTRLLLPFLDYPAQKVVHTYQSRFGKDPWLTPYTDETIDTLAKEGVRHIAVVAPGFTTDCLETLDELGNEGREAFLKHGGEKFSLIPCLNADPDWIDAMKEIVTAELGDWIKKVERPSVLVPCPSRASA